LALASKKKKKRYVKDNVKDIQMMEQRIQAKVIIS
jgi:hypothetical protein